MYFSAQTQSALMLLSTDAPALNGTITSIVFIGKSIYSTFSSIPIGSETCPFELHPVIIISINMHTNIMDSFFIYNSS